MAVPPGTRVVLLVDVPTASAVLAQGTIAVAVGPSPDAARPFRIRGPNGDEAWVARGAFRILAEATQSLMTASVEDGSTVLEGTGISPEHVVLACVVGSRAYGLARDDSDVDVRGVYQAPTERVLSLDPPPEQLEDKEKDECYWELRKFLLLALRANPNALEVLWTPLVARTTPVGDEMRAMRGAFLSRLVFGTFGGYAMAQLEKLRRSIEAEGTPNWKNAMHLIRLLESGIHALETGDLEVRTAHAAELREIREGAWTFDRVDRWRKELHARLERAAATTRLPEGPDVAAANALLVRARRSAWPARG